MFFKNFPTCTFISYCTSNRYTRVVGKKMTRDDPKSATLKGYIFYIESEYNLKALLVLVTPWDFLIFHRLWIEEESMSQCLLVKYLRLSTRSIIKQQKFEGKKKNCPPTKLPWSLGNQSEEVVLCVQLLSAQWIRNIDFVHKCISLKI